ncbi:MAG: hypothetical protein VXX10_01725, partial [Pseudomonadota bacterium]|nr:hypothetical protein [Pseudomonadota bacterium]
MSVFRKLRNFLNKKETRVGLAGLGAVAGFGGFEGMKYGDALTKGIGGLNVASGLSAGGTSGALQAGLGGYNLAQGFGKVGTFQDTYRNLFAGGQAAPQVAQAETTALPQVVNNSEVRLSSNNALTQRDLDMYREARFTDPEILERMNDKQANFPAYKPEDLVVENVAAPASSPTVVTTNQGSNVAPFAYGPAGDGPPAATGTSPTTAAQLAQMSGGEPSTAVDRSLDNMEAAAAQLGNRFPEMGNVAITVTAPNGETAQSFFIGGGQVVQDENGFFVAAEEWRKLNTPRQPFSFEALFDNVLQRAQENPLQAVSVGSALASVFMESPQEKAAREYAESVAQIRRETDPNSDFGQTFQQVYTQQRQEELDEQYTIAKAELTNSLAKRGLTDSTIATSQITSLNSKYA